MTLGLERSKRIQPTQLTTRAGGLMPPALLHVRLIAKPTITAAVVPATLPVSVTVGPAVSVGVRPPRVAMGLSHNDGDSGRIDGWMDVCEAAPDATASLRHFAGERVSALAKVVGHVRRSRMPPPIGG